jgi:hypothetical protein
MSAVLRLKTINGRPILRGYEHIWSVILDLTRDGSTFTRHDIDQRSCDPGDTTVTDYLRRLLKAGYVADVGTCEGDDPRYRRRVYRLVTRSQKAPRLRRDGSAAPTPVNQLLWNTMRILLRDGFTVRELAAFASTDDQSVSEVTAASYVKRLANAGFLHCLEPGRGRHLAKWRLKPGMNTGPFPPKVLRTHAIYDPNTCSLHGDGTSEEVAP